MRAGKMIGGGLLAIALGFGAFVYYAQEYMYYEPVDAGSEAAQTMLTSLATGAPEPIPTEGFEGIDADSSPLRFRSCFRVPTSLATLTETYQDYSSATPLNGPRWFDCFDAARIGADLEAGTALAFLSLRDLSPGVDRVVAIYPDGRAYAWNQLNETAEK